jgi:hypothetical protein
MTTADVSVSEKAMQAICAMKFPRAVGLSEELQRPLTLQDFREDMILAEALVNQIIRDNVAAFLEIENTYTEKRQMVEEKMKGG